MLFCLCSSVSRLSDAELRRMSAANTLALADVSRAWSLEVSHVEIAECLAEVPEGACPVSLVDRSPDDDPTMIAYHSARADSGLPFGIVLVTPEMSIADIEIALSHELFETAVDPLCIETRTDAQGRQVATEVCDPTEGDSFGVGEGDPVACSNWVTPAWFDLTTAGAWARGNGRFDRMDLISDPFALRPGGYVIRDGVASRGYRVPARKEHRWSRHSRRASGARVSAR